MQETGSGIGHPGHFRHLPKAEELRETEMSGGFGNSEEVASGIPRASKNTHGEQALPAVLTPCGTSGWAAPRRTPRTHSLCSYPQDKACKHTDGAHRSLGATGSVRASHWGAAEKCRGSKAPSLNGGVHPCSVGLMGLVLRTGARWGRGPP